MRLDQTIGSLTCGDLEISLRLRVTELKKMGFVYLLNLFGQRGEKGGCDLMHRNVCGATLDDWANGGSADVFFTMVSMVLVLWYKIMLHCFREVKSQQGYTPGN